MAGVALRAGGGGGGGGSARQRRALSRRSPTEGGDGEGRREWGSAGGGAGAGRAPDRGARRVATGVPGFSRGPRPPRCGQSRGSPRAFSRVRPSGRTAGGETRQGRGPPSSSAPLPWGCPDRAPRPYPCRSAGRGPLRRAPSLLRLLPSRFVSGPGRDRPLPRWCRGVRPGRRSTSPGSAPVLGGSAAEPRAGPVLRAPRRSRSEPEPALEPRRFLSRSFRRDVGSALAQFCGCYIILQQRNCLQQMHVETFSPLSTDLP